MKLIKLIETQENKKDEQCPGQIYRFRIYSYITATGDIIVRKTMRKLKRDSCPGCEKCEMLDQALVDQIVSNRADDVLVGLKNGGKYKLIGEWEPGPFEYPKDGDLEMVFEKVAE